MAPFFGYFFSGKDYLTRNLEPLQFQLEIGLDRTKTYQFNVEFEQDEDGVFIADEPALPGSHSFGATLEEAERIVHEAIIGYLEMPQKNGEPIPVDKPTAFILKKAVKITIPA